MTYILLIIGFGLLIFGANYFVDGSSKIAALLNVPPILIGLTIVAFGTSSPEAIVSIMAALQGSPDVAIGNVVGSNIFNVTLVIGITAIIYSLKVEDETIRKEIPFTLLASAALLIMISDTALQSTSSNVITRSEGLVLLLFFVVFMYYIFEVARKSRNENPVEQVDSSGNTWGKQIFITIMGLAAIIFGGNLVVSSSTDIAYSLGMSETLVGLTIVAVGTSLPELVTSISAALKKQSEIALGNIVGSNIFNIFFILGISSVITPLTVDNKIFIDVTVMILLTVLLLFFSRTHFKVGKYEGMILAGAYILYLIYIIIRN